MPQLTIEQALQLALEHHQAGRLAQAEALYRQILDLQPNHADALHLLGVIAHQAGRHDLAVELIRRAITQKPDHPAAYNNLSVALKDQGQFEAAVAAGRQAVALKPDYAQAYGTLGDALQARGQLDAAITAFHQALALNPKLPETHCNLGNALQAQGQLDAALAAYRQAIALNPNYPEVHNNYGNALKKKGQLDAALAAYRQAIALQPGFAETHYNLGMALYDRGQRDAALAAYRQAIALKPDYPEACANLGNALKDLGQLDAAIATYRQAIALNPGFAEAHYNLGLALNDAGQPDAAIAAYRQAIVHKPDFPEAFGNLGNALKDQGYIDAALAAYRQAVAVAPENAGLHSNVVYALLFDPDATSDLMREELGRWNARHAVAHYSGITPHANAAQPGRRLKVGYVSPDFFFQAEACFVVPLLEAHDHLQFEIHAYASVRRPDAITSRLQQAVDHWHDVRALSDAELAARIRADGIDILIDLTMHMAQNRMGVFARKPAPVQVTWLAYPGSTGLRTMDYRLTDAWMDPPGPGAAHYSEQSVRLPDSWCCYHPLTDGPEVGRLPALERGYVTFGSLNNPCKQNPSVFTLWARVLANLPEARLMLLSPEGSHRQAILDFFRMRGIAPHRIELVSHRPRAEYLLQYQGMDIALDPFPYNGITTTCDALWMGVPVLSRTGVMAPARAGLSLLENAGLGEFAARTDDYFVRLARALADDLPRLSALRATLRERMEQSPLMDAPRFARHVEAAYRHMWRQWCATG